MYYVIGIYWTIKNDLSKKRLFDGKMSCLSMKKHLFVDATLCVYEPPARSDPEIR